METITKKSIVYGLIWSLSYPIQIIGYAHNFLPNPLPQTIWFPYWIWTRVVTSVRAWSSEPWYIPLFIVTSLAISTSISIIYVILKILRDIRKEVKNEKTRDRGNIVGLFVCD